MYGLNLLHPRREDVGDVDWCRLDSQIHCTCASASQSLQFEVWSLESLPFWQRGRVEPVQSCRRRSARSSLIKPASDALRKSLSLLSKLSDPCAVPWWHPSSAHKGYFSSRCSFFGRSFQNFSACPCLWVWKGIELEALHISLPHVEAVDRHSTPKLQNARQDNAVNWMSRCCSEEQVFDARRTTHSRHVRI